MERGNAAKERILSAAIAMVERWGIEGATTRVIAAEAGVNVAAVNYHFRTKNTLLAQAIEKVRTEGIRNPLFEIDRELSRIADRRGSAAIRADAAKGKPKSAREAARRAEWRARENLPTDADRRRVLASVLDRALENGVRHPKAAFAHLRPAIVDQQYGSEAVERTNAIVAGIEGRFHALVVGKSKKEKILAVAQAWSAIVLASLAPGLFTESTGIDLLDAKARRAFVSALLGRTLTAEGASPARRRVTSSRRPRRGAAA